MTTSLPQRSNQPAFADRFPASLHYSNFPQRQISLFSRTCLLALLSLMLILGVIVPWADMPVGLFSRNKASIQQWRQDTLSRAASFVAKNGTLIVCAVSHPYLPFLNILLISISRQKRQDMVLVIAEDYATLDKVNERWPGHAVVVPPTLDSQAAHKFGSQGGHDVYCTDDMTARVLRRREKRFKDDGLWLVDDHASESPLGKL